MSIHTHQHYEIEEHSLKQDHEHQGGMRGHIAGLLHLHKHDHSDLSADSAFADNEAGIRTVWIALGILAVTSILQLGIVYISGSVALLADTAHNIGDGLNSIPLMIAFYLVRRAATRKYTYGYGRAEDIAGIFIVLSILISAGIVFWETFQRLLNPQLVNNLGWVAAAAIIGFLGNETVAVMQIRVGKNIGSAALVADGLHARTDGLTSLAVLLAAAGSWLNLPMIDPIIGFLIGFAILFISWDATKRIWYRLMDAVEPEIIDRVETTIINHPNVQSINRLRLRWVGHQLHGDVKLSILPSINSATVKQELRYEIRKVEPKVLDLAIDLIMDDESQSKQVA